MNTQETFKSATEAAQGADVQSIKAFMKAINALTEDSKNPVNFSYRGNNYCVDCYCSINGEYSYSVRIVDSIFSDSMNVYKITSKFLSMYTYSMMNQRTNYKMAMSDIKYTPTNEAV